MPGYFLSTFPFKASEQRLEHTASTKLMLAKLNYLASPLEMVVAELRGPRCLPSGGEAQPD